MEPLKKALLRAFNCHGFPQQDFDDVYQEFLLYKLDGKAKHQMIYHFVIDYFIKQKSYWHSIKIKKHGPPPRRNITCGEKIETFGQDCSVEDLVNKKMVLDSVYQLFSHTKRLRKKRKIMLEKFRDGMTSKEIAKANNLTEPRISQIIKECIIELKKHYGVSLV